MLFNLEIKKRIARYIPNNEKYVCGNSGDSLKIVFDDEWAAHEKKTARFIWNGKYFDQEFSGDTVEIPVITKTSSFSVGVYVGEAPEDDVLISSTYAVVPCELSVRCTTNSASAGTGANYTNEAKGAAAQAIEAEAGAEAAAEEAKGAAAQATEEAERAETAADLAEAAGGLKEVGSLTYELMAMSSGFRLQGGQFDYEAFANSVCDHIQPFQYKTYQVGMSGELIANREKILATGLADLFNSCKFVKMAIEERASNSFSKKGVIHEEWITDTTATTDYADGGMVGEGTFSWVNIVQSTTSPTKGNTKLIHVKVDTKIADWQNTDYVQEEGYALWLSEAVQSLVSAYWNATQGGGYAFVTFTGYN